MKLIKTLFDDLESILESPLEDFSSVYSDYPYVEITEEDFKKAKNLMLKHNPKDFYKWDLGCLEHYYESNNWIKFNRRVHDACLRRKTYRTKKRIEKEVRRELGIEESLGNAEEILIKLDWILNYQKNIDLFKKQIEEKKVAIKNLLKDRRAN